MDNNVAQNNKVFFIQLLRVLSCLMVFSVHFGSIMPFPSIVKTFTNLGAFGVYLFFIISGYLAFINLDESSTFNYYIKRFFRIAPLFYLVILVNIIMHTFIFKDVPVDPYRLSWLRYFFFLFQIIPTDSLFWSNISATWTIGIFAVFYIIAPLLYIIINNYSKSLCLIIFFCLVAVLLPRWTNYFAAFNYLYHFAFGIALYFAIKNNKKFNFAILLILLILVSFLPGFRLLLCPSVFSLFFLLMSKAKFSNKLFINSVSIIDNYSYAIYLFHALIIGILEYYNFSSVINALIIIFGTLLLSYLSTKYISDKLYQFIKGKLVEKSNKSLVRSSKK